MFCINAYCYWLLAVAQEPLVQCSMVYMIEHGIPYCLIIHGNSDTALTLPEQ